MSKQPTLKELDAILGGTLARANGAPPQIILAVLARALELKLPTSRVAMWLRFRNLTELHPILDDVGAWRVLVAQAKRYRKRKPDAVRRDIARGAVAALITDLPAGEAALVALLAIDLLDDESGWDTIQLDQRFAVTLGCNHTSVRSRLRKLAKAGIVNVVSAGRGVSSRVRFPVLRGSARERLEANPTALALVDALVDDEGTDTSAILRSIALPAIGYGNLTDAAWQYVLLRALDLDILSISRRSRARKTLRDAGLDPDELSLFADAVADLSEGDPTRLRDEAHAAWKAYSAERAPAAAAATATTNGVHQLLSSSGPLTSLLASSARGTVWADQTVALREIVDTPLPALRDSLPKWSDDPSVASLRNMLDLAIERGTDTDAVLGSIASKIGGIRGIREAKSTLATAITLRAALETEAGVGALRKIIRGRALQAGHLSDDIGDALQRAFPTEVDHAITSKTLPALLNRAGAIPERSTTGDRGAELRQWTMQVAAIVAASKSKPTQRTALRVALRRELIAAGWSPDVPLDRIFPSKKKEEVSA